MSSFSHPFPPPPAVPIVPGQAPAGMIPAEAALLQQWLLLYGANYDTITYNLRVGRGQRMLPSTDPSLTKMVTQNSQRRIDALLMQGRLPTIIEVKVRGSLWALGQLQGYSALWLRDNPNAAIPNLLMVCGSIDLDTEYVFDQYGVPFSVVQVQ